MVSTHSDYKTSGKDLEINRASRMSGENYERE
jgi:hypothetical protein